MPTTQISITELKAHLSEYIRRASASEEIVITNRGRPVARMVAAENPDATAEEGATKPAAGRTP